MTQARHDDLATCGSFSRFALSCTASILLLGMAPAPAQTTILVSASSSGGTSSNGYSTGPSVSSDGNLITFVSRASDIVPGTSNHMHVFVRNKGLERRPW
jgi:hypothetical protein